MFEQAIEKKREKMIYFAERYGMTSQKTVDCSQELDRLLNAIWHVHTDFHPNQTLDTHTHNNVCVSFISKKHTFY
ncbi:Spo0E family sporulation regulatory protein-aspartic acid phosphatase [Bacillus paranthracis]|nr:aspartyl-phosphate phosphatase Spo0E family protein [Bacillus sp. FDAARGOS_527]KZD45776.1 Spo0E-like putative sporulation regulatory protein in grePA-PF operon [Bacillus cereus]QHA25642.1 Spo0E family sporulation regulatory protein-aspartic acid phosphatase [Bacillus paranthracis]KZD65707.1 Spo0E-like putative sporulation regulatory protein in grePA-PF operon [Bacillus cereus]MBD0728325.1 stage 0 sporulation protein [Bacillus cereus]